MTKLRRSWLFGLAIVATNCGAQPSASFRTVGPINAGTVTFVESQIRDLKRRNTRPQLFMISYSPGGDAEALLKLVDLVDANADRVFVSGECLSACAEFLYLVNKPITAAKNAKIGFHGNALTASSLVKPFGLKGTFACIDRRAERFRALLRARGVNSKRVTQIMIQRLGFYRAQETVSSVGDACRDARFYSNYRMWFPTTEELRSLLKIDIHGPICSDDAKCIQEFAAKRWSDKPALLVGDQPIQG